MLDHKKEDQTGINFIVDIEIVKIILTIKSC